MKRFFQWALALSLVYGLPTWVEAGTVSVSPYAQQLSHATDCPTGVTNAKLGQSCVDLDDGKGWYCKTPSAGGASSTDCDVLGDWLQLAGGSTAKCGVIDCVAPVSGNFTGINMGSATLDISLSNTMYLRTAAGTSATVMALQVITVPATPYVVTLGFRHNFVRDFNTCGIALHTGGSGATRVLWPMQYTTGMHLKLTQFASLAGSGSDVFDISHDTGDDVFLRIDNNGTNTVWSYSAHGYFFEPLLTEASNTGITPDRIGFACAPFSSVYPAAGLLRHFHVQ